MRRLGLPRLYNSRTAPAKVQRFRRAGILRPSMTAETSNLTFYA